MTKERKAISNNKHLLAKNNKYFTEKCWYKKSLRDRRQTFSRHVKKILKGANYMLLNIKKNFKKICFYFSFKFGHNFDDAFFLKFFFFQNAKNFRKLYHIINSLLSNDLKFYLKFLFRLVIC